MKRDWDTVRDLLTRIEELRTTDHHLSLAQFKKDEAYSVSYHMNLLIAQGLVQGEMIQQFGGVLEHRMKFLPKGPIDFHASRLTWEGHDFLDAIRNDTVWHKTKETFADKGLDMTFDTIKSVAIGVITAMLS